MFHQIIFVIILCGVLVLDTFTDTRLYYHLLFKRDYLEWTGRDKADFQDSRTLLGERRFKILTAAAYGVTSILVILVQFALFRLSKSFAVPLLTHVAATSLLLTILGNSMVIFIYPIPGVTNVKLERPKVLLDLFIAIANYACLIDMLVLVINFYR
ncbi:hypothetical protein [Limosilactobacillus antri]|uniref:Uncharacterized protein n=1 Tax=Limosilactobacillus antri DSM 16041 TaxID=525309 RepID=C8P7H4_9LACO|nr:hypothetical protein [Limosilactobacillus antri]EEW53592.1 hypothetical protein HMPREF0494_1268 [Limosilactobacillus antri DSM 16041]KRK59884.1 hypothetical protein FC31_GL000295 [Limosilactobacillus antri DSM 16041]